MPHQADAFAGLNPQREVAEKRLAVRSVAEGDAVENHFALADVNRSSAWPVCHAQRQYVHLHQVFHLVHAALQVGHVLAHVAQVAMHDEVAGKHKGDSAGSGAALPPQPDGIQGHRGAQTQQNDHLGGSAPGAIAPVTIGTAAPLAERPAQACIFPRLGAEGLHHGVAGNGIGE